MTSAPKTSWRITGDEVVGCNCAWGCPCQFNALPTRGNCDSVVAVLIREGHFGDIRLEGVRVGAMVSFPGALHEGNGTAQWIIDSTTTPEQRRAVNAITSGNQGGLMFGILSAICPSVNEPLIAPISFECDRETRVAHLRIPGIFELHTEPIKNPVTGEEHRARIVLPDGFEYKEAEIGNSVSLRATRPAPLTYEYSGTYAQLNAFDWSNA